MTTLTPSASPRVVRELADDLAVDADLRDRAGKPPFDEVARLREAGLPALLTPPAPEDGADGRGSDWRTACTAVREIAAADSSIAELLAHHHALSWSPRLFAAPGNAAALERRAVHEQWLWGGDIELPDAQTGTDLTLAPTADGHVLHGRRPLTAGVAVADRLVHTVRRTDSGEWVVVHVNPAHPGVSTEPAHDLLGQRLSGAGAVSYDDVPVAAQQVLGTVPVDEHEISPYTALAPLTRRLLLVQVGLGNAEGALSEARDISRALPRPALTGALDTGADCGPPPTDPYLLLAYGELATAAHTAAAVVELATEALARGLETGPALGADERADITFLVGAAEAVTAEAALHITTRVLELTAGTPSPSADPGIDRFWRNARALTAHSSAAHRLRDIGEHYLNGLH
ncbi:FMNH2-dependent monooxygenase [Streptomyces longisporoflavus]|uniref:acyl-CoA dehydrogenase n=1 Tax=Streptomyces longisporoflavus TaxID=28044 RepID=UPI00167D7351|nr:acyl-CoA dehydrogenase [Streptomyces longisporoflavus]GGV22722.1 FMNH2-dependent monooxygenase [Streptomyces longisporoflavus]